METKQPTYEDLVNDERATAERLTVAAQLRRAHVVRGHPTQSLTPAGHYLGAARDRIEQADVWKCAPLLLAACRAVCARILRS